MADSSYQKYGKFAFFLGGFIVVIWILFPFLRTILLSLVLVYLFYPIFAKIEIKLKNKSLASLLTVIIIVLCFMIPATFVTRTLIVESTHTYNTIKNVTESNNVTLAKVNELVQSKTGVDFDLVEVVRGAVRYITEQGKELLTSIPARVLNFFILLFLMYYIFKEHKAIRNFIIKMLPFPVKEKTRLLTQFADVVYGVLYGQIVTAIVQGVLAGIGYAIFGLPSPVLWAIITMLFALVPMIGTAAIWVPASIYLFIVGFSTGPFGWGPGVALFLYGLLIVGLVDNFLRPILIGEKSGIHPALVLLGAFGGLGVFGFIGIIIGPLVIAVFKQLLIAYYEEGL
jgi:predicted PurR-regulated permease PerM